MTSFHKLSKPQQFDWLINNTALDNEQIQLLQSQSDWAKQMEPFSENVIGAMSLPLSIVPNVIIDGISHHVPISVEESSVVASLCNAAKIAHQFGHLTTTNEPSYIIAQIFIPSRFLFKPKEIMKNKTEIITRLNNTVSQSMFRRGGGVLNIEATNQSEGGLIKLEINPCDAHGANLACQVAEQCRVNLIAQQLISGGYAILSNQMHSLTTAQLTLKGLDPKIVDYMTDMSLFAQSSSARAVTHNKGIMNGIDGLLVATGNDWRANASNCIDYAAKNGPLSTWTSNQPGELVGTIKIPIQLGVVGGLTSAHPVCELALSLLNKPNRDRLERITAAIGLLQNFAALKAIGSHCLVSGHMRLHLTNRLIQSNKATSDCNIQQLKDRLSQNGYITQDDINDL